MQSPLGKPWAVCSLHAPLTPILEAGAHHPISGPLLLSKQSTPLHTKKLVWETAHSQMLGDDQDEVPVAGQGNGNDGKDGGGKEEGTSVSRPEAKGLPMTTAP